jgi:hypothetical protein
MRILQQFVASRPVGGGWGGETVCGRGAAGGFRRGSITSSTVEIPSVCGKYAAGRERSGNGSVAPSLRDASDTPRRNVSGANGGQRRPRSRWKARPWPQTRSLARGHAAENIQRFFVTVPAVMSRRGILLVPLRRIVATPAARPCVRPATVNASGCGARPKRGDSNATWSTRPHGPNAAERVSLAARLRRGGPRRGLV